MPLARDLWDLNSDLAAEAFAHPFVQGLADGSLPADRFAGYLAQDAFYLEAFIRSYALAIAHSPDRAGLDAFADLLAGCREELTLHAAYAAELGIDLATVTPSGATLAYTDFLKATAALGGVGLTCAAMTPCMRLYAHLGSGLAPIRTAGTYTRWIETYANPEFHALAATLERLLDTYATDTPAVRAAYRQAMRLEVEFFDSAFRSSAPAISTPDPDPATALSAPGPTPATAPAPG